MHMRSNIHSHTHTHTIQFPKAHAVLCPAAKARDTIHTNLQQFFSGLDVMLRHVKAALLGDVVPVQVGGSHPQPLDVGGSQASAVVRHVLRP